MQFNIRPSPSATKRRAWRVVRQRRPRRQRTSATTRQCWRRRNHRLSAAEQFCAAVGNAACAVRRRRYQQNRRRPRGGRTKKAGNRHNGDAEGRCCAARAGKARQSRRTGTPPARAQPRHRCSRRRHTAQSSTKEMREYRTHALLQPASVCHSVSSIEHGMLPEKEWRRETIRA